MPIGSELWDWMTTTHVVGLIATAVGTVAIALGVIAKLQKDPDDE